MKKSLIISLVLLMLISICNMYDSVYYLKELIWYILSFIIIYIINKLNLEYIKSKSIYLYILNIILLIMTLFIGYSVNGSKSWIKIFGLSIQPSEFIKIPLILYLDKLSTYKLSSIKYSLICILLCLIPSILVFLEPDTGPIITYIIICISYIYLKDKKYFFVGLILSILVLLGLYILYLNYDGIFGSNIYYRINRITSFINADGYQIKCALKSISTSGLLGGKYVYVPEDYTDFAFTRLINNYGIIGLIVFLFVYFIFLKSINKKNNISFTLYNVIFTSFIINMLMNISLFPIVGIPLPFLSYGGSNLVSLIILLIFI